jgi:hypothetical protein
MVRYDWAIPDVPTFCGCGSKNNINHALVCKKGGYPILWIESVCAFFAVELTCPQVLPTAKLLPCQSHVRNYENPWNRLAPMHFGELDQSHSA